MPYMGEDVCGTYQYLFERPEGPSSELGRRLFPSGERVFPMHVKTVLEKELIDNNVNFLYSSFVSDVLSGDDGEPAGIIISNRTGRQAILCKCIIDCTQGAYVGKLAGAYFDRTPGEGDYNFRFITIGKNSAGKPGVKVRELPMSVEINGKNHGILEHEISLPVKDFSFASLAEAEQVVRDRTWNPDQVDSADLIIVPRTCRLKSKGAGSDIPGSVLDIPLTAFMPERMNNLYILSRCLDASSETAEKVIYPDNQINLGEILGKVSARNAVAKNMPATYSTRPMKGLEFLEGVTGGISEMLRTGLGSERVYCEKGALPVLGEYDVVVAGGGTAGAPAGIGAAREGAGTLVLEYLHGLGGTGTLGMIGRYWYGHREGFTNEIDKGVSMMAESSHPRQKTPRIDEWVREWKVEWYRKEIRKAGGKIWYGVIVTGAFVLDGKVRGVVVSTPEGSGVLLAKLIIDSTGSADVAIAAGADYEYTGKATVAVQGSGLPKVDPDDHYNNTDWTFVDDSDIFDVTRVFISGKQMFPSAWDIGKLPQTRERRRVKAEFMVSPIDMLNGRRYKDTISYHVSNFDTHGFTVHPYFIIKQPDGGHVKYNVDLPLRSLLPVGLDGIIVTGLGAGAHRDAMPVIRMQPCLQNQGYAVGYLAAKVVKEDTSVRKLDFRMIQKHLVEIGNLPERVTVDDDSSPFSDEAFKESTAQIKNDFHGLEILFSDMDKAQNYLEGALKSPGDKNEKLNISIALGVLGNDAGWELLADTISSYDQWDDGWNFTGMHQFGHSMSLLDTIIIALGKTKKEEALPVIIAKAETLTPGHKFSHFRAVSIALETIGSSRAAEVLYSLLKMGGVSGHHVITHSDAVRVIVRDSNDVILRNNVLRELHLARALYRCGDKDGLGRQILNNYSNDLHGHYFRHAAGILELGPEFL
jgi:hypothetical protein